MMTPTLEFEPIVGAKGLQLSNPDILSMTSLLGSLQVFSKTDMIQVRRKSTELSAYLRQLLKPLCPQDIKILTPEDPTASGAQLSIEITNGNAEEIMKKCQERGVIIDMRSPNVLRLAPTGLYNTFVDVHKTATTLIHMLMNNEQ